MSVAEPYPQPNCPQCRENLRLIVQEGKWFCDNCKRYVDVLPLSHVSLQGTKEGRRAFSNRFILMLVLCATLPALFYLIFYLLLLLSL